MPLDYFAEKYLGKSRQKKFVYGDAWGSVVSRNEAWIILEGLITDIKNGVFELDILGSILRQKERLLEFEKYELEVGDMARFYEKVIQQLKQVTKKGGKHGI